MNQISFNDLYQMRRKAQEIGWQDTYLKWHIWEPAFEDVKNGMKLKSTNLSEDIKKELNKLKPQRNEFLGIPAIVYGQYEQGEMLGFDLILENQKLGQSADAFTLKVSQGNGIVLKKYWLREGIAS